MMKFLASLTYSFTDNSICLSLEGSFKKNLIKLLLNKNKIDDLTEIKKEDIKKIKKQYFNKMFYPLKLTHPKIKFIKKRIKNLKTFEEYYNKGYYGRTTPEIGLETFFSAILTFLKLLENSSKDSYSPTNQSFKDIIIELPFHYLVQGCNPDENEKIMKKYSNDLKIKDFLKEESSIEIIKNEDGIVSMEQEGESFSFEEILRRDFTQSGKEEVLFYAHYHSSGTLHYSYLSGAYYNGEEWKKLSFDEKASNFYRAFTC